MSKIKDVRREFDVPNVGASVCSAAEVGGAIALLTASTVDASCPTLLRLIEVDQRGLTRDLISQEEVLKGHFWRELANELTPLSVLFLHLIAVVLGKCQLGGSTSERQPAGCCTREIPNQDKSRIKFHLDPQNSGLAFEKVLKFALRQQMLKQRCYSHCSAS